MPPEEAAAVVNFHDPRLDGNGLPRLDTEIEILLASGWERAISGQHLRGEASFFTNTRGYLCGDPALGPNYHAWRLPAAPGAVVLTTTTPPAALDEYGCPKPGTKVEVWLNSRGTPWWGESAGLPVLEAGIRSFFILFAGEAPVLVKVQPGPGDHTWAVRPCRAPMPSDAPSRISFGRRLSEPLPFFSAPFTPTAQVPVTPLQGQTGFASDLDGVLDEVRKMLVEKNAAYGNSALNPTRIFSKASIIEQLLVRIDDKLSRLARGSATGEDVELDLLGYLLILRMARKKG